MKSRLMRFCLLALAAFAVMPGTAMALDSSSAAKVDANICWTGEPCPPICVTTFVCVDRIIIAS